LDITGLNTRIEVVGREQDSGETEREGERGRALLKMGDGVGNKIGQRENIYDGYRRIILDH
jgi:hypothetical protein